MTNYFRVSRGVRQGCPLNPLLFVLSVEVLAQNIRQNPEITGLELPNSIEAKLSQFADNTTLICKDTMSSGESMSVLGSFGEISGLKLNSKKTKAMWIDSLKNNKTKPLEVDVPADPIKTLGTYLSNDRDKNNDLNFFLKIQKMETKLNIWLSRDFTLMGRTLLAKTLGVSKLPNLKSKPASTPRPMNFILDDCDIFDLSKDKSIQLSEMKCKDYYHLF